MTADMKKPSILAFALALAFAPPAAFAVFDDITAERFPDADAVVVDTAVETSYGTDGSFVALNDTWVKILTEKGRQEESVQTLRFNVRYGREEFTYVGLVGADGEEREVDVSATTSEMTDNSSASSNIYDPMSRRVVCTIPGIRVGDVLHVKSRETVTKSRVEGQFFDLNLFEHTCPVVRSTLKILSPAGLPLAKTGIRNPLGNVKETHETMEDGSVLHTWTAENSPQAFPEPSSPTLYTLLEQSRVSTISSWPELSRWYWNLCVPHLEKTTPGMSAQIERIGRDIGGIYHWVAQEIRYMGLTLEDTSPGYAPHDVDVTFENRYGVCRDKAALLVAMLRIAGFEAFPVLINNGPRMDPEIPLPYFNHAIVAVRAPGDPAANADGFILMDPTDETSRELLPSYLDGCSYLVATPEGEPLHVSPVTPATANTLRVESKGTLDRDGSLVMDATMTYLGINDNFMRGTLLKRRPEERRRLFEQIVRAVAPGSDLVTLDITPRNLLADDAGIVIRLVYRVPEAVVRGETRDELSVPMLTTVTGLANFLLDEGTSLEKRRFPLVAVSTAMVEETADIDLGGALGAPVSVPGDVSVEGGYSYSRSFSVADGRLVAKRTLAVNAVEFPPEDYAALRENMRRVETAERERPVFAKDSLSGADVRVRLSRSDYTILSPDSWVVTNTVVKEILTYNGKKKSSELKFSYNPLVKSVELVSATVANPDGRVAVAGEREINEFSCEWAASAPRYPASREIVVNLPSVEVGSVVSYTVASAVTNAPSPFRAVWYFDTTAPADEIAVTVDDRVSGRRFERVEKSPRLLPVESMQPDGYLWRDRESMSKAGFASAARRLASAARVAPLRDCEVSEAAASARGAVGKATAVRDWMARHLSVVGPSLYELPLEAQTTDPAVVMRERYATRLDYARAMCAAMKGAGLDADVVFAAADAGDDPRIEHANLVECPNPAMFDRALCRIRVREGGFLGFGGKVTTYFVGTENEYTPFGATPWADCHYLDPADGSIGVVAASDPSLRSFARSVFDIAVREGGAVDFDCTSLVWGPGAGTFRKKYAEMLAEDRSRHFQEMLGSLSRNATATRDLVTDTESYPARMTYSAYAEEYATVADGAVTLNLPMLAANLFPLTGSVRRTPVGISGKSPSETEIRVTFPEGYTEIEHIPEAYAFGNPQTPGTDWYEFRVTSALDDAGRLVVTLLRETKDCGDSSVGRDYFALIKDWGRASASLSGRTIVVRRASGDRP